MKEAPPGDCLSQGASLQGPVVRNQSLVSAARRGPAPPSWRRTESSALCPRLQAASPGRTDRARLQKANDLIVHRGPDDEGLYLDEHAALAMRRLSIIDLSTGHQPICNEDGSVWIVFNGEIYNHKNLKAKLKQKHVFSTKTDTEIILHLYEEEGPECIKKLDGMFVFAIYDNGKLFIGRDRIGIKPLYFGVDKDTAYFASEIKALLLHPATKRDLDNLSLWQYFAFDYVPQPRTIFKQINKLESGQILVCEKGKIELKYYGFVAFTPTPLPLRQSD